MAWRVVSSRPLINARIEELEQEFVRCGADVECLRRLLHELSYRRRPRAQALKARVEKALEATEHHKHSLSVPPSPFKPPVPIEESLRPFPPPPEQSAAPAPVLPSPEVKNTPGSILDAWTALEVLSPQTFRRPEELAGGDRRAVALWEERLPWEGIGERARPNTRLFYQVVLAFVDAESPGMTVDRKSVV